MCRYKNGTLYLYVHSINVFVLIIILRMMHYIVCILNFLYYTSR